MLSLSTLADFAAQQVTENTHTISVCNPATGALLGVVPFFPTRDVRKKIHVAEQSFRNWSSQSTSHRSQILWNIADALQTHQDFLAKLISLENGKPFTESLAEVQYSRSFFRWFAEQTEKISSSNRSIDFPETHTTITVQYKAIGVCAAITPWNFPLAMLAKKASAALAAGCALLCKPAEETPLSAFALQWLAEQSGLPQGLLQIVTGDASTIGQIFCNTWSIRKLSFTGSTAVGQHLMRQSASTLQKLSMELGGNAPFIVLESADLDCVMTGLLQSKFRNSGQTCIATNRCIVVESQYVPFLEKLKATLPSLVIGPAFNESGSPNAVQIGPLISKRAVEKIRKLLLDAIEQGASIVYGELPVDSSSLFVSPIVITGIQDNMDLWWEEIFGPVICCCTAKDSTEAIALANQSNHGLGAYLFTEDPEEVATLPSQIETGMVGINTGAISMPQLPFGGVKASGFGREGGIEGIFEYMVTQSIVEHRKS